MRKDVIDAEFEVISGPSPVKWQPERKTPEKRRDPWFKIAYAVLLSLVAGYVLLLGLAGADLDTTDSVDEWKARQPVAATLADQ